MSVADGTPPWRATFRQARPAGIRDNRCLGLAALLIGFALIITAAWLAVALLRLREAADFLLAVYLFSAGGVILVVLALSPFALVTRTGVIVASAAVLALAAVAWYLRGRPAAPSMRAAAAAIAAALRDPVLAILAAAVALGLVYAAALAIGTPPNEVDVVRYHLTRAALWAQEHGVHYIDHASTTRLNENPPGAEILSSWAMTLEGNDRYAGVFQVIALAATVLAIARIARLLGFSDREAAFGALLFATLPVVALQASTAQNDLVMASLVAIVVAFMIANTRTALGLGALALVLSVFTKGTALFTVPMLLVVAAVLVPLRRWLSVGAVGAVSIALGGLWYVFHHLEAGGLAGEEQSAVIGHGGSEAWRAPVYAARLAIDAVDPAGAVGRDRYAYAIAATVLLVIAGVVSYRGRSRAAALAGVGAAVLALLPIAFPIIYDTLQRGYQSALEGHADNRLVFLGWAREPELPSSSLSWYGPAGVMAFLAASLLVVRAVRLGELRKGTLVLTFAPVVMLVIVAAIWAYSPGHGRFFMPAVALSAATWGVLHRVRAVGWALSAIAVVTLVLSLLHYREKPAGISLLAGTTSRSVWTASAETVMFTWPQKLTGERRVIRELDRRSQGGETVALRLTEDHKTHPYFGPGLERRVVFVDENGGLDAEADWLVIAPELNVDICPGGWRSEVAYGGWRLYRRVGLCPGESAAS